MACLNSSCPPNLLFPVLEKGRVSGPPSRVHFKTAADSSTELEKSQVWQQRIFVVHTGKPWPFPSSCQILWSKREAYFSLSHLPDSWGEFLRVGLLLFLHHVNFSISKCPVSLPPDCSVNLLICQDWDPSAKVLLIYRNHHPPQWVSSLQVPPALASNKNSNIYYNIIMYVACVVPSLLLFKNMYSIDLYSEYTVWSKINVLLFECLLRLSENM